MPTDCGKTNAGDVDTLELCVDKKTISASAAPSRRHQHAASAVAAAAALRRREISPVSRPGHMPCWSACCSVDTSDPGSISTDRQRGSSSAQSSPVIGSAPPATWSPDRSRYLPPRARPILRVAGCRATAGDGSSSTDRRRRTRLDHT